MFSACLPGAFPSYIFWEKHFCNELIGGQSQFGIVRLVNDFAEQAGTGESPFILALTVSGCSAMF